MVKEYLLRPLRLSGSNFHGSSLLPTEKLATMELFTFPLSDQSHNEQWPFEICRARVISHS